MGEPTAPAASAEDIAREPLTKAKLFTSTADDGAWTEMGLGVVSVRPGGLLEGSAETNETPEAVEEATRRVWKLEMMALDDASDVLLSTPLAVEDIYLVQHDTILVWSDPQLGRDMACSFNTREGCTAILEGIHAFQRRERAARAGASLTEERLLAGPDRWAVTRENVPTILEAARSTPQRFGLYMRERMDYFSNLVRLFRAAREAGDEEGMGWLGDLTLVLLRPPFSTEGKIIAQVVENAVIDDSVDMVQYGLGRRTVETGFVGAAARRAAFRNPLRLPDVLLSRIHALHACAYLKDLLPLTLDEGDAMSPSLFSSSLLRFTCLVMEQVCCSETFLSPAFSEALSDQMPLHTQYDVLALTHEMTKTVRNTVSPVVSKGEMIAGLVRVGFLPFVRHTLGVALRAYRATPSVAPGLEDPRAAHGGAVMRACDSLVHCIVLLPSVREDLATEARTAPSTSTLRLLLESLTVLQTSAELQYALEAILHCIMATFPASSLAMHTVAPALLREGPLFAGGESDHDGDTPRRAEASPIAVVAVHVARLLQADTNTPTADDVDPAPLSRTAELQAIHGLRVLEVVGGEMGPAGASCLVEVLVGAGLPEAFVRLLRRRSRGWANVQSSLVALLAALVRRGEGPLMALLQGREGLLDAAMRLYLAYHRRNNVLASSLGHLFVLLCEGVHREKARAARPAELTFMTFLYPEDVSTGGGGAPPREEEPLHCLPLAEHLLGTFEGDLAERLPALLTRLRSAVSETPKQAQLVDAESSTVASSLERPSTGATDFDAMVLAFGVDPPLSRGASSPSTGPPEGTAPVERAEASRGHGGAGETVREARGAGAKSGDPRTGGRAVEGALDNEEGSPPSVRDGAVLEVVPEKHERDGANEEDEMYEPKRLRSESPSAGAI